MVGGRPMSSKLSVAVIDWLVTERGLSHEQIAEILEVTPGFINRVRGRERGLTTEQLEELAEAVGVAFGAMLLAILPPEKPDSKYAELRKLGEAVLVQGGKAMLAIRQSIAEMAATKG